MFALVRIHSVEFPFIECLKPRRGTPKPLHPHGLVAMNSFHSDIEG